MSSHSDGEASQEKRETLERELREWWEQRNEDWESTSESKPEGELWEDTPEIDSKEVVKAGVRCEEHLEEEFDPSIIREGGYDSIDDLIDDIVPKMMEKIKGEEE